MIKQNLGNFFEVKESVVYFFFFFFKAKHLWIGTEGEFPSFYVYDNACHSDLQPELKSFSSCHLPPSLLCQSLLSACWFACMNSNNYWWAGLRRHNLVASLPYCRALSASCIDLECNQCFSLPLCLLLLGSDFPPPAPFSGIGRTAVFL